MSKKTLRNWKNQIEYITTDSTETKIYTLTGEERLEIHLYYAKRVVDMERKQNTPVLETIILDTCQYKKSQNYKFNTKAFLQGMAKKCHYKYEKLYSGMQKRRIQKRWAKRDFLKCRGISIR